MSRIFYAAVVFLFLSFPVVLLADIPRTLEDWEERLEKEDPEGKIVLNGEYEEEEGVLSYLYDLDQNSVDIRAITVNVDKASKRIDQYIFMFYGVSADGQEMTPRDPTDEELDEVVELVTGIPSPFPDKENRLLLWTEEEETDGGDLVNSAYDIPGVNGLMVVEYDGADKVTYYRIEALTSEEKRRFVEKKKASEPAVARGDAGGPPVDIDACRERWSLVREMTALPGGRELYVFSLPETQLEGELKAMVYVELMAGEKQVRKITPKVYDQKIDIEGLPAERSAKWDEMNAMLGEITGGKNYSGEEEMEDNLLVSTTPRGLGLQLDLPEEEARELTGDLLKQYEVPGLDGYMLSRKITLVKTLEVGDWYLEPMVLDAPEGTDGSLILSPDMSEADSISGSGTKDSTMVDPSKDWDDGVPWTLDRWMELWRKLQKLEVAPLLREEDHGDGRKSRLYAVMLSKDKQRLATIGVYYRTDSEEILEYRLTILELDENGDIDVDKPEPEPTLEEVNALLTVLIGKSYVDEEAWKRSLIASDIRGDVEGRTLTVHDVPETESAMAIFRHKEEGVANYMLVPMSYEEKDQRRSLALFGRPERKPE